MSEEGATGMLMTRRSGWRLVFGLLISAGLAPVYAQSNSGARHHTYFIQGAVKRPGAYQIEGAPSMLKLLSLAGGLEDSHGSAAFIIRKMPAPAANQDLGFKIVQTRIDETLTGRFGSGENLEPGDIVNIPPSDVFFVAGDGKSAVAYPFTEGVTLLQAIARARGVISGVSAVKAVIYRQDPGNGRREAITVDLDSVRRGKQQDVPLQPNDVVWIPNMRVGATPSRFQDAPPILLVPCRGGRPCVAQLDLSQFELSN